VSLTIHSVGKALATARMAKIKPDGKAMTQKDLATAVNAKPQDVRLYVHTFIRL
jgi:putative transcription factor